MCAWRLRLTEVAQVAPDVVHGDEAGQQREGACDLELDEVALGLERQIRAGDVAGHVAAHLLHLLPDVRLGLVNSHVQLRAD